MTNPFSLRLQSIITGSMLGDGHITPKRFKNGNCYFTKTQSIKHREFLEWTHTEFGELSLDLKDRTTVAEGKTYWRTHFSTRVNPVFTDLRSKWYPEGVKIVPADLQLDPLSIAIWFTDDGSNTIRKRQATFATNGFQSSELDLLIQLLDEFDIRTSKTKSGQLRVLTESYKTLIDMVRPYITWKCFERKIRYRDSELVFTTDEEALKMFELYDSGVKQTDIAEQIGKSVSVVSSILRGERMKHLGRATAALPLKNTSGFKNVYWDESRHKWRVSIKVEGITRNLGRYTSLDDARLVLSDFLVRGVDNKS